MAPLLAQRARADRAFEKLYQRHVGDVYRYALVVMRNPDDAEDVTQTTFMNAYRAFSRGERPRTPQNWLIAIAHNVCRQRFRQLQRRPNETPLEEDEIAQIAPDDETPSAEDIRRALSHLAFNQRAALVMRELEGRSYAEIGEILELSTSAVETLIFRARRALREQLAGSLSSFFGGGGAAVGTGIALKAAAAVTTGLVIGGAGYEGARQATKHTQAKTTTPIFQSVTPDANVPAPREHIPITAHGNSVKAHGAATKAEKSHGAQGQLKGKGHGKAL